jgi:hypothetical protein
MKEVLQTVTVSLDLEPVGRRSERMRPRFITLAPSDGARARIRGRRLAPQG